MSSAASPVSVVVSSTKRSRSGSGRSPGWPPHQMPAQSTARPRPVATAARAALTTCSNLQEAPQRDAAANRGYHDRGPEQSSHQGRKGQGGLVLSRDQRE